MKTVIQPESWDSVLKRWRGAEVQVWMYHATHSRLALRVFRYGEKEVIYIVAVGCKRIAASFHWTQADLRILPNPASHEDDQSWRLLDGSAGFDLSCSGVAIALASASDFDVTFDGFLGEIPPVDSDS